MSEGRGTAAVCLSLLIMQPSLGGCIKHCTLSSVSLSVCLSVPCLRFRGGFLNYATSCCMTRIGLQCTKWRHSKLLFCLFLCEKKVAAKNERHTVWTRHTSYVRRKRRIQFVQCTNTTTNHFITTSSPAKFDCIAQRGWTGNGDNPICAQTVTIR